MSFRRSQPDPSHSLVAVDLGSNSFHMIVVRSNDNKVQVLDQLREMVRLGAGLDEHGQLDDEAQQRALACLQRFAQRLRDIPSQNIRIVGTNTLRRARNARAFIRQAQQVLGHPIEIISGLEEARLIYLGVSHSLAQSDHRQLVVDIGGGSTEVIIGKHFRTLNLESLAMGCVSMSRDYFANGKITNRRFTRAGTVARLELQGISRRFCNSGWDVAIGASGTVRAIEKVLQAEGWCNEGIDRAGLKRLRSAMLESGRVADLQLKGLPAERLPVFVGGYVVLQSVFDEFNLQNMVVSDGAVREGLIYQLIGRIRHEDVQESTLERLLNQYDVDVEHGNAVESAALSLLPQVAQAWDIGGDDYAQQLSWAARLHELGLAISHGGYHKHGAYLALHADLPGFSWQQQQQLSSLIRCHRRKISKVLLEEYEPSQARALFYLCVLLRLAVIFQRSRAHQPLPEMRLKAREEGLKITLPAGWLASHALTEADLHREIPLLAANGFRLRLAEVEQDEMAAPC